MVKQLYNEPNKRRTSSDHSSSTDPKNASVTEEEFLVHEDQVLGSGSSSVVTSATHKSSGTVVAAKTVNLATNSDEFYRELSLLLRLEHDGILCFYGWKISSDDRFGTLFLQKFQNTLEEHIENEGPLRGNDAVRVMYKIVDALAYVHDLNVTHSDLKPENIAYDRETKTPRIFDFGYSVQVNANSGALVTGGKGSPLYMSPQALLRVPHCPFKSDLWSLGVTFYEMVAGATPFDDCENVEQLFAAMRKIATCLVFPRNISRGLARVLRGLLKWEPDERVGLKEVRKVLKAMIE